MTNGYLVNGVNWDVVAMQLGGLKRTHSSVGKDLFCPSSRPSDLETASVDHLINEVMK